MQRQCGNTECNKSFTVKSGKHRFCSRKCSHRYYAHLVKTGQKPVPIIIPLASPERRDKLMATVRYQDMEPLPCS